MKSKLKPYLFSLLTAFLVFSGSSTYSWDKKDEMAFKNYTFGADETCEDDCSYFAQNDFDNNMDDYEVDLAGCLDGVTDEIITDWASSLAPGIPEWTNFQTVYDIFVNTYPDAMNCLSQAESNYNDSMDNSADNWEDCSNGCQGF